MAEGAEGGTDLAHGGDVEWVEGAEGGGVEVEDAAEVFLGWVEFLIAREDRAGDDAGLKLEKHERAGVATQAGGLVVVTAAHRGEFAQEDIALHVFDGAAAEAFDFVAHGEDADGGDRHGWMLYAAGRKRKHRSPSKSLID